jgi:hypothetical protein
MPEIKQTTVYKFSELSEKAKEKALNDNREINTDYDWAEFLTEQFKDDLKKIGIYAEKFYWDLDRNRFMCLDKAGSIEDDKLFLKYCKVDLRSKRAREIINENGLQLKTQYFGGSRQENYIESNYETQDDLTECLQDKFNDFLKQLTENYEYLIGDEAIKETIEANEYSFRENGEMFY